MTHRPSTATRSGSSVIAADPVDVATVRALWCALHPDAAISEVVNELVTEARDHPEILQEAMRRLQSGRLERSTWVIQPALAVLEAALAETVAASGGRGGQSCTR